MATIPASAIVEVSPDVLAAGGTALDLNGLVLTTNSQVPMASIQSFVDATAVGDYFGSATTEKTIADKYFGGFKGSTKKPGALLFAQYNTAAVAAYLRGGDISAMTVAQLQALNAALSVTIDAVVKSATINLSAATSLSNAASIIGNALLIKGQQVASVTGSIAATTLTVSAVASGALAVGSVLTGTGVTAGTYITAFGTGTGGTGTYTVNASQTAGSTTITGYAPGVTYDSVSGGLVFVSGTTGASSTITYGSGALATSLLLTAATGAVLSQGAITAVPATFMDAVVAQTQNWAGFMTAFNPDSSGNTNKLAFAAWVTETNDRYAYICWDNDATPALSAPATASLGYLIAQALYSGTSLIGQDAADASDANLVNLAAFELGVVASIDFDQPNGRTDIAFRAQDGLLASVTSRTAMNNLIANGYNFYGAYGTANDEFVFFYPGSVSGEFLWMDSYVNQIWINNAFQLAAMVLLTEALSIPFNQAGYTRVESALADPINAAVDFGAIQPGVTLSSSQITQVNSLADKDIAGTLQTQGWYLAIQAASSTVRQARGPLSILFFYVDGESVQAIDISSILLQ